MTISNGIYSNTNGIRTTTVTGSTFTGLYAADGSYNIVLDDASHNGLYHPCGAWRVSSASNPNQLTYDPSGAYYLSTLLGTAGTSTPATPEQFVGDGGRWASLGASPGVNSLCLETNRNIITGRKTISYVRALYCNAYGDSETNGAAATLEVSVANSARTTIVRFTWGGNNTYSISPGELAKSDRISAAALGFASGIPANTRLEVRDRWLAGGTGASFVIPTSPGGLAFSGSESARYSDGASASQVMNSAALVTPTGGSLVTLYTGFLGLVGVFSDGTEVSMGFVGDSQAYGLNDGEGYRFDGATNGMFGRACYNGGARIPWANFAISGGQATTFATTHTKRCQALQYCTHVMGNWGTNDVNNSRNPTTQIMPDIRTNIAAIKSVAQVARYEHLLTTPRTVSSTDVYTTAAGQTPATNFGVGGNRDTLNTALLAEVGLNGLDAIVDIRPVVQDATITSSWAVDGVTNSYMTSDGIHESTVGHVGVAALLNPLILAYTPVRAHGPTA